MMEGKSGRRVAGAGEPVRRALMTVPRSISGIDLNSDQGEIFRAGAAVVCDIEHFREAASVRRPLQNLKDKTVLSDCTGGIRCEKASALFRSKGFKNVFQLAWRNRGYQKQFPGTNTGKASVFRLRSTHDRPGGRRAVQMAVAASGRPTSRFVNCLHDPCHKLFICRWRQSRKTGIICSARSVSRAGISSETAEYMIGLTLLASFRVA